MKIALVDDEKQSLNKMLEYCREYASGHNILYEFSLFESGEAFLKNLKKDTYSIVFIDIYMTGINGIEAARQLRKRDNKCFLIFLTSSPDYMRDAFSFHAFEYILKPFTRERIFQVLDDIQEVTSSDSRFIEITSGRKTIPVFLSDLMSAVSDGHYLEIGLSDGSFLRSRMTVREFLTLMDDDPRFLPVNKGIVLNADYINRFENNCCILENGTKFPIKIRNRLQIEQAVRDYNFEKIRSTQRAFSN